MPVVDIVIQIKDNILFNKLYFIGLSSIYWLKAHVHL